MRTRVREVRAHKTRNLGWLEGWRIRDEGLGLRFPPLVLQGRRWPRHTICHVHMSHHVNILCINHNIIVASWGVGGFREVLVLVLVLV